jgi:hypothetical protein
MNNSFNKKMNQKLKINLNDLSSTSSEFFLDYNKKKSIKQKGGNCPCMDMFKAISNENLELILYILKQKNCCFLCRNSEGNTILHSLVPFYNSNNEIKEQINEVLDGDCSEFINIQNNEGQTPILLAVMEDDEILAEKMENAGADVSIEDNNGNFVGSKEENKNMQSSDINTDTDNQTESVSVSVPVQNIYNVFNFIVQNPQNPELTSLGINDISEPNQNSQTMNLETDEFMDIIKKKIDNSLNNDDEKESSSSSSSEYIELPEIESSVSSMNTDKFITLLDENKNPSFFNYSDIQDTDQFITILRDKYSSQTSDKKQKNPKTFKNSDTTNNIKQNNTMSNNNLQNNNLQNSKIQNNNKNNTPDLTNTSDMESSINTQMIKLENETTSDENVSNPNTNFTNIQKKKSGTQINNSKQQMSDSETSLANVNNLQQMYDSETSLSNVNNLQQMSDSETSLSNVNNLQQMSDSETSLSNVNNLQQMSDSETSLPNVNSIDSNIRKLADQTTSDNSFSSEQISNQNKNQNNNNQRNNYVDNKQKLNSKANVFYNNNNNNNNNKKSNYENNLSTSDIDTDTLLKAIKKIQNNYESQPSLNNDTMKGGAYKNKKQQIMGYRQMNEDSDLSFISVKNNKKSGKIDYNSLYNSDSEFGSKANQTNELSRMMARQKETLHHEVLEILMGMLNKGLLTQSNKPIEASERNAKLVKAYIYRQISEKNPEMGGMDKILSIKTMNENEIINIVKKMPNLDELEESIKKHLEDKSKYKNDTKKTIDTSETSESESEKETKKKNKKTSKKSSKK